MKRILPTTVFLACAVSLGAQDATFSYFAYEGRDTRFIKDINPREEYLNPILSGFYPDPSVCRVGDTYYLVNSSFSFFPGVPIFRSGDLVNWTQIGHVLDRESQLPLKKQWVSGGIYAPDIAYNPADSCFYMITTNVGRGNFFVRTTDPLKGWSNPVYLPEIDGIDPSLLFDTDGKAYIVHNAPVMGEASYDGERAIRLLEFSPGEGCTVGEPLEIVRGGTHVTSNPIWIEGPHLYHIGEYYYLMCAEGGTGDAHSEVIFRSSAPQGPWEESPCNPILTQRSGLDPNRPDIVTSAGHADLVQTPGGEWWAVFLGCRPYEGDMYNTGRDTYLLPVSWKDGWPVILPPGEAIPTAVRKEGLDPTPNYLTGNFSYTENFGKEEAMSLRWVYLRNPKPGTVTLSEEGLTLHPTTGSVYKTKPLSAIFCRQQHTCFSAETRLVYNAPSAKGLAGITLFQDETHNLVFGKTLLDGLPVLVLRENSKILGLAPLDSPDAPLRLKVEADGRYCSFSYAEGDDAPWQVLATGVDASLLSTARSGGFIGAMIGLYATRRNE